MPIEAHGMMPMRVSAKCQRTLVKALGCSMTILNITTPHPYGGDIHYTSIDMMVFQEL